LWQQKEELNYFIHKLELKLNELKSFFAKVLQNISTETFTTCIRIFREYPKQNYNSNVKQYLILFI
jgi:hypothetical protein